MSLAVVAGAGAKPELMVQHISARSTGCCPCLYMLLSLSMRRMASKWTSRVRSSSCRRAFHDDAASTVSAIVGALGLGAGKTNNAARRSSSGGRAGRGRGGGADLLFEHPNCALAAVVNNRTLVPHAMAEHDEAWLPLGMGARARQGGAPQPRVGREA